MTKELAQEEDWKANTRGKGEGRKHSTLGGRSSNTIFRKTGHRKQEELMLVA